MNTSTMISYLPKIASISLCAAFICTAVNSLSAQTTLSGDHIITGDLNIGTSGAKGNLEITGETGSISNPGIKVTGDGGFLFGGTFGTGQIPASGAGTRFMWYPAKSAFRGGRAVSTEHDDNNIGQFSFAFGGQHAVARGISSTAIGFHVSAHGDYSTALGAHGLASGYNSSALSGGHAEGWYSSALSGGSAAEPHSVALSLGVSSGWGATAMSYGIAASAYTTAMSEGNALGSGSVAARGGTAEGVRSIAIGDGAHAKAAYSVAVGRHNLQEGSPENVWIETDPLFVIGNGTGNPESAPEIRNRNAFAVYKNGDVRIPKAQGDILMGQFGN